MFRHHGFRVTVFVTLLLVPAACWRVSAQEPSSGPAAQQAGTYSAEVVAKAEAILAECGLKRSGKSIRSTDTAEVSRGLAALSRQRRALRSVRQEWQQANDFVTAIRKELQRLDHQQGQLNLQLANVAGRDVTANNRIVGLIEATRSRMRTLGEQEKQARHVVAEKRAALNQAEAKYAETVLAIRRDFHELKKHLDAVLVTADDARGGGGGGEGGAGGEDAAKIRIALKVLHQNFETPANLDSSTALLPLNKRIEKIEQEIFSESIPLDVQAGSLYVNVVVGDKTARMVVDSGATLISLPAQTAAALGIKVPADARQVPLVMADGRSISSRMVTLERVRVGEFVAENVQAAVLDSSAVGAQPLLGMSYLGNFKFEIDTAHKSLKMLRVAAE